MTTPKILNAMKKIFSLLILFIAYTNPTFSQSTIYVDTNASDSFRTNIFIHLNDALDQGTAELL